jgi:aminopeptidase-like protein
MPPVPGPETGEQLYALVEELYPVCRSITGDGVRSTLETLTRLIPLETREIPSGRPVFDWTVPKEWNIRDAYIKDASGKKLVDFNDHTLHVVSYSTPINARMSLEELRPHLFTLPEQPELIPYRTSYYKESWGFCLAHNTLEQFGHGPFEVVIDSTLEDGALTWGELTIEGEQPDQVLLYTHVCHPSLCNDNLSGIAVLAHAARHLLQRTNRYTYRIVFAPGTIGAITWLSENENRVQDIRHGLITSLLGDRGCLQYKRSRRGNAEIDRVVEHVLKHSAKPYRLRDFIPYGYDERQFCSPGFNLPVGRLTRTPNGEYPQYHTSGDDLALVSPTALAESLDTLLSILRTLEQNRAFRNLNPKCEPQLGKRGLYRDMGGVKDSREREMALLWVLNLADGDHSLLDMAQRSGVAYDDLAEAARDLLEVNLVEAV